MGMQSTAMLTAWTSTAKLTYGISFVLFCEAWLKSAAVMQPPLPEDKAREGTPQPSDPRAQPSQSPARSTPATPLVPDHEMLRCIGSGSYGEVWLARNATGQYRAAKVLYHDRFESERPYEREFAGITRFEPISRTHDGFVDILQVGRNDPTRCF